MRSLGNVLPQRHLVHRKLHGSGLKPMTTSAAKATSAYPAGTGARCYDTLVSADGYTVLELNSPRWQDLRSAVGGSGQLASELLKQVHSGDVSAYAELLHQCSHQFTFGEVAYAVLPHLTRIASECSPEARTLPLKLIGSIEASRGMAPCPELPADLTQGYLAAKAAALPLALDALNVIRDDALAPTQLLATVAALHGQYDLALHVFLSGPELSCPSCGEYIRYREP